MLLGLNIRDIVLIDRLDLALRPGLCVLTGETGAGKSILLDALGLALGKRAESGLVRTGAQQATVSAEFSVGRNHPAHAILREAGLDGDGEAIVLRRLVGADGRSRAFVNDEPAGVGLLRQLGESLVEIQGQFEQRGLLDPTNHRMILDAFAEHSAAETAEALALLEATARDLEADPRELEKVEERLFALRAAARKHQVAIANLPRLREQLSARLAEIEAGADSVEHLARATAEA